MDGYSLDAQRETMRKYSDERHSGKNIRGRQELTERTRGMMEYMVQDLVEMLTEGAGIEYDDAMHTIYDSDIYEKLMDAETGLSRESPSYVYGLLQDEINFGHIVQAEV